MRVPPQYFYQILPSRIHVINHQPSFSIQNNNNFNNSTKINFDNKFNLPKNYIFYPSAYLPHKNHVTLIDSIHIIAQEFNKDIKLVLCGYDIGYKEYLKEYLKAS